MNQAVAALLGAATGAFAALSGSVITNIVSVRNERARRRDARYTAHVATLREYTAAAFSELFAILHAINWITWFARFDTTALDTAKIAEYDREIHTALPKFLGSMTMVACLDLRVYEDLQPVCEQLYSMDRRVAVALRTLETNEDHAIAELRRCLTEVLAMERTLPQKVARIMAEAGQAVTP